MEQRRTWWERLRAIDPLVIDGVGAAVALGLTLIGTTVGPNELARRDPDAVAYLLILAACVPLAFRRRAPIPVLWVVCAAAITYAALGYRDNLVLAVFVACYTVAAHEPRERLLRFALPPSIAAGLASQLAVQQGDNWVEILVAITFSVGIPMALGRVVFNRRRRLRLDRERAAQDAVVEERARIARELHDIVAHAMSVMVVQAGAARTVVDRDPERASEALRRIEETGRDGLAEMRRLIGVLKADDETSVLAPQPGLAQLDQLLDGLRGAGLPVEAVVEGTPRPLSSGVDLTAYRVVQEGLTNVLKHAGPAHARATIRYAEDAIDLEVADDGRGPLVEPGRDGGHGLIGMRERVGLFDGTLEMGARPGGGFVIRAHIPTEVEA